MAFASTYEIYNSHQSTYSRIPLIRTLVIRIANYSVRIGPSGKIVKNSTKLTCLEVTGYRIKLARSKGLDAGTYCK